MRAVALEVSRACAGEALLPQLRGDQSAAGALPSDRAWPAGPDLLALVLAAKYGQHLPLTRQSAIYAREGVEIDVSTLADWVGAAAASLMPLIGAIREHVFAAKRIHADDSTVPKLAKEKTKIGHLWAYVRDDQPFAGPALPAVTFFYSPDRGGEHPERHLSSV